MQNDTYHAGTYNVSELRKKHRRNRHKVAAAVAVALLGVGAASGPALQREYQDRRERFVQRLIAEELGRNPIDAGLNEKQLRMRLAQEYSRNQDLIERILTIAEAVDVES